MSGADDARNAAAMRRVRDASARFSGDAWRAVEAQHVVSTRVLVDTLAEQKVLEDLLDEGKPRRPPGTAKLHYLLFTPFRYRPPPVRGSRFRGPNDPGVFYAADEVRTACAELGYWRWRHLADSPALASMPMKPQTVFRSRLAASSVDLRVAPFAAARERWTDPDDYGACQALARVAREAKVQAIRYESVRDPRRGGCVAGGVPAGGGEPAPRAHPTGVVGGARARRGRARLNVLRDEAFDFAADAWRGKRPAARVRKRR